MVASISEEILLQQAVAKGLLTERDIAQVQSEKPIPKRPIVWGPVLDELVHLGKVSDVAVREISAELSRTQKSAAAMARTLDGESLSPARGGDVVAGAVTPATSSAAALHVQDQTLASLPASGGAVSVQVTLGYPAPHWDKYEFLDVLGRGGMGTVYKARDRRLGRLAALKFIHGDDKGMTERFLQEARSQGRLAHPNICQVYEVGAVDGKPYIAMEYVDGHTLDRAGMLLSLQDKIQVFKDAADAVHAAHEQGVIHRDLKPSNIMVGKHPDGSLRPVLMDFGLAREMGAQQGLTESGAIMGTPAYMPPEQARGDTRRLDRRSDVYSLGATLYDVLTGNPPFDDQTVVNILLKVMNDAPLPLRSHVPTLPAQVELIVSKCLNKEPAQRYATAKDLADDLQRYLTSQRVVARRLSYTYRLAYWARRNKTLAVVAAALVISSGAFVTSAVRGRLATIRQQQKAKAQAELAQRLGQSVKDVEWVARTSYLLPLHDVKNEQQLVRARMAELKAELAQERDIGERLGAYVQGRGHLALHDYPQARTQLLLAEKLGHRDPELDYALGRAYGALYTQALEDARRSGDKSFFDARKKELDVELLAPTLAYLNKSRGAAGISVSYVQGLVAFYQQQYEPALRFAEQAHKEAPWLYEAVQLGGQVRLAQALDQRDRGEHTAAEQSFTDAAARLSKAAEIGRSDHQVYEALAETYIRWEELDYFQAKDPAAKVKEALLAADRALAASPEESHGHTKKSYAYLFLGNYLQRHGKPAEALKVREQQLAEGKLAVAQHADDAYAYVTIGGAYMRIAESFVVERKSIDVYLKSAYQSYENAVRFIPRFPWAYNDHALAVLAEAEDLSQKNTNPLEKIYKAIELSKKAYQIDPKYIYSYNTVTVAAVRAAAWMMEHGIDPLQIMKEGETAAQKALQINPIYNSVLGNLGDLHMIFSMYGIMDGRNVEKVVRLAISEHERMLSSQDENPTLFMLIAFDLFLLSTQKISQRQDPSDAIDKGFSFIDRCYANQPSHPLCQDSESLLLLARAQWLEFQAKPFLQGLERANQISAQALAQQPNEPDTLLHRADIAYSLAQARMHSGLRATSTIQAGLVAAEHALLGTVGWPRAQALKGALLLLSAKTLTNRPARLAATKQARQALTDSFAGNPLLRRRFGGLLGEVEQLLQEQ